MTKHQAVTDRYRMPLPVLVRATPEQIKRHDYDGLANFDQRKPLQPVKVFGTKYITEGTELNHAVRKAMGAKWGLFTAVTQLREAHERGSDYEIRGAFQRMLEAMQNPTKDKQVTQQIAGAWAQPGWSSKTAPVYLPPAFACEMESAKLVLWWNNRRKRFLPALFCGDYSTAMFARAALRDLSVCPECGKPFIPARPDQEYHDIHCRERHRQRRHREKLRGSKAR